MGIIENSDINNKVVEETLEDLKGRKKREGATGILIVSKLYYFRICLGLATMGLVVTVLE